MPDPAAPRIRPARPDEVDDVGRMWHEMYAYQQQRGMMLPLRDDAVEIYKHEISNRLDTKLSVIFVAELDDGLAGFLAAQTKRLPPFLSTDKPLVGYIGAVYVRPAARRHHLGKALVDASFAWFERAGVGSIELQVIDGNELARAFWEGMGFQVELVQMRRI
jgi:ribosomal protein S18 acetylase RimI-like enzyme